MSTAHEERVPPLTLGWRLKMALAAGDVSREEMARELGMDPGTLSRWMSDKGAPPKRAFVIQWAIRTNTSMAWLETGDAGPSDPGPGRPSGKLAALTARKASRSRSSRSRDITNQYAPALVAA